MPRLLAGKISAGVIYVIQQESRFFFADNPVPVKSHIAISGSGRNATLAMLLLVKQYCGVVVLVLWIWRLRSTVLMAFIHQFDMSPVLVYQLHKGWYLGSPAAVNDAIKDFMRIASLARSSRVTHRYAQPNVD